MNQSSSLAIAIGFWVALASPGLSQTEIFREMTSELCSDESREAIAQSTRNNIENYVARAESSIEAPIPIGDLACLDGLMEAGISQTLSTLSGTLSGLNGIMEMMSSGLGDPRQFLNAAGETVSARICELAAQQWAQLTNPLNMSPGELQGLVNRDGGEGLPPSFTDNFGLVNVSSSYVDSGEGSASFNPESRSGSISPPQPNASGTGETTVFSGQSQTGSTGQYPESESTSSGQTTEEVISQTISEIQAIVGGQ